MAQDKIIIVCTKIQVFVLSKIRDAPNFFLRGDNDDDLWIDDADDDLWINSG